jgi:hypothetical protein
MTTSNIEPLARALCERDLRLAGTAEINLAAAVDRYWHCVASLIESGLIDDNGGFVPHDLGTGLAAYRDWRSRHPADAHLPP